MKAVVAH